jgi:hypothetical protein
MQLKSLLFPILTIAFLAGCGGGDPANPTPTANKLAASSTCLNCHASAVSPTTGALISDEWRSSSHNLKNGAGCADCHEPASDHPNACSTCHGGGLYQVTKNPDQAGKCFKCHGSAFPNDPLMALAPQHFGYSSARALPKTVRASYVSGQYQGRCGACHNPHNNTLTQQHRDYATSAHGDPKGAAWTHYDFKQDSYAACARCHTSTGFISYVTSNFTVATKGFGVGGTSREMVACDACHTSYDFKHSIRKVPQYTATYQNFNGTALASFPDSGESNICITCHSGRASGQSVNAIPFANFTGVAFVNPHYLATAGLMYMQSGFTDFTSATASFGASSTYGKSLSPDNAVTSTPGGIAGGTTSTHRKLGTTAIRADSHKPTFFTPGVLDQNGPCVTCHLNGSGVTPRPGSGHSLKIDGNAFTQVCVNCHVTEGARSGVVTLTPDNFRSVFIEPQAEGFATALKLIQSYLLDTYKISFDQSTNPYFFDETLPKVGGKKQAVRDWTRSRVVNLSPVNARKLMGACFNLNLLARDPAAYAHARSYSRRLVYDSLDFLDNGVMDRSVGASAVVSGLTLADGSLAFIKDTKAYNASGSAITTIYGNTSEAMLYLVAWSRTDGTWSATERP